MHIYDESTSRRRKWTVKINWSRELTFSERQINYIRDNVHHERGVYCIYAKDETFKYIHRSWSTSRWSPIVYIGSGWLDDRLSAHLDKKKNQDLAYYLENYSLVYRFDRIYDDDESVDWPLAVEAALLNLFVDKFKKLPCANHRLENIPPLSAHLVIEEPGYFNIFARG